LVSDENLGRWIKAYGLKEKLRVAPTEVHRLEEPEVSTANRHLVVVLN
jgi:hypothetical protein